MNIWSIIFVAVFAIFVVAAPTPDEMTFLEPPWPPFSDKLGPEDPEPPEFWDKRGPKNSEPPDEYDKLQENNLGEREWPCP
ncbi:hypothetical protein N7520_008885 [Penicillium odoratum]|uniref:uncharacterized protein n=1 Tax=Penicillium odoratum TaxID=1167516 RepID=UPI00254809E5|nr:uncharacterized protein N7520_008885 [Penicillium odoratum]KAJ5751968.1 hypothetical protein N7520_008885 [Penicillium odoratum]